MDIPGRLVRTGAAAAVLVLEAKRLARARRPTRMASLTDLQARLLIGGEDEIPLLGRGLSFHRPSYRSRTRPALSAKSGSRGKIQLR